MSGPAFYSFPAVKAPLARLSLLGSGLSAHWALAGSPMVIGLASRLFMVAALELKQSQFEGLMADRPEEDGDKALAIEVADQHKRAVLEQLRARR